MTSDREQTAHTRRSRRSSHVQGQQRRRRRILWGTIAAVAVVLAASTAWVATRGLMAKNELEAAVPLASKIQGLVASQDTEAAVGLSRELAAHAQDAAALTGDPVWRAYEVLPWVGDNLRGMRVLAAAADIVASGAVMPLAEASTSLDLARFAPVDGRIDLQPIIDLQEPVQDASTAFELADQMIAEERLGSAALIEPLARAREQLVGVLDETGSVVVALRNATQLVPAMLGGNGARDILLLFQNNAELRSTGGIPGALALLHTDGGGFDLVQQANSGEFPRFDPPVVDLPVDTRALWGDNTARYIQDVTFTPQFAVGASVAREMWAREFGVAPASVVALDPVVLSYLLRATGPITLATGDELTADNAVQMLLRDVYERYEDPAEQDLFFSSAAASVLDAVSGGHLDPRAMIDALAQAGVERRILIWNADPHEQAILEGTSLAGELPKSNAARQAFGVYLNDMTMSKMDAYLDVQIAAGTKTCRADGLPQYEIEVTLTNTAPADAAVSLPAYVTGGAGLDITPGDILTSVHVYSAPGTYNLGVTQGGQPAAYAPTTESGYTLSKVTSDLAPGESTSWRFAFLGDASGEREVVIQSTPMIYKSEVSGLALSCD
jgi:hypothetical protein